MSNPEKCTIVTLDGPKVEVTAQYNPKEVSIDKSVPWNKHKNPKGDIPMLEFTNAENRTLSLELFFDTYEEGSNVWAKVKKLHEMTLINPSASKEEDKHPPRVLVAWGGGFPKFRGVIESLGYKYTMFLPNGTPVRATCTLKIKEVDEVQLKQGSGS
ncbi:MAG: phage tail protein [Proteobacteria bacterium]|nr:phage tail protein [Pseudomonadota bacterium]